MSRDVLFWSVEGILSGSTYGIRYKCGQNDRRSSILRVSAKAECTGSHLCLRSRANRKVSMKATVANIPEILAEGRRIREAVVRRSRGSLEQESNTPSRSSVTHSFGSCEVHVGDRARYRTVHWGHRNGYILSLSMMDRRLIWVEQGKNNGSHSRDQELGYHNADIMQSLFQKKSY